MSIFKEYYDLWTKLSEDELAKVKVHEAKIDTNSKAFIKYKDDYVKRIELMHLPVSEQPDVDQIDIFLKRYLAVEMLKQENKTTDLKLSFFKSQTKIIIIGILLMMVIICIIIFFITKGFAAQLTSGIIGILSLCGIGATIFIT